MKLNRRGFFGFGAGAVAAAPQALKNKPFWAENGPVPTNSTPLGMSVSELIQIEAEREAVRKQIDAQYLQKLHRIASGDITDEETGWNTAKGDDVYRRYLPLKSVSEASRDFMQDRRRVANDKRDMIKQAKEALERYDRTGMLKQVLGWYNQIEREVHGYD